MSDQGNHIHQILDHMLEGCQIIGHDWQYLYLNEAACAQSHLSKEQLLGRKMMDVFPGIENTAMFQQLHKCMEQRQPVRFNNEFSYPDLTSGWFDISVLPVEEGILVMSLDLSLVREARYRNLFDNMLEGFALCQMIYADGRPVDFIYLHVNEAFSRLTGLKNVEGKRVTEVIPGVYDTNPELFEVYGRVASSGSREKFETYLPALGIWLIISVYSPETGKFVMVFENSTARRKAEIALKKSNEELEQRVRERTNELSDLYNNVPCGYHSLDAKGVFVRVNDTELSWLGYSQDELVGKKKFTDLVTDESRLTFERNYPDFMKRGWINNLEFDILRKDGTILPVLLSGTAVKDSEGNFLYSRSAMINNTEQKRAEAARQELNRDSKLPTWNWKPLLTQYRMICAPLCGQSMGSHGFYPKNTRLTWTLKLTAC